MDIGPTELIIILIIVVLVFGVGRLGKLGGELGNAIREFRQGLNGERDNQPAGAAAAPELADIGPAQPEPVPAAAPQPQSSEPTSA